MLLCVLVWLGPALTALYNPWLSDIMQALRMSEWLTASVGLECQLFGRHGRLVTWDVDLVVTGNGGDISTGRRSLEFRLVSRTARLHLPDLQNLKKIPDASPTNCGVKSSMTEISDLQLD